MDFNNTKKLMGAILHLSGNIAIKTQDLIYQAASPAFLDLMQLNSRDELCGKSDLELFDDTVLAAQIQKDDRAAWASKSDATSYYQLPTQNGERLSVECHRHVVFNSRNQVESLLLDMRTLPNQEKLIEEEKAIFHLLQHLPCHVYLKDREGVYVMANNQQAQTIGFQTGEDFVGKTDYDLYSKEYANQFHANDLKAMNEGKPVCTKETLKDSNGKERIFLTNKIPFYSEGQVAGTLGISTDITEDEEARKKTEKFLENLLSSLPEHIYWKDKAGHFLGCNKLQAQAAGLDSPQQMIGKTDFEMPWIEQAELYRENERRVMETGTSIVVEENVILKSSGGEVRNFLSSKAPLLNEKNEIIGILGISTDITELKKTQALLEKAKQQAEAASAVKSEFIANMSHDIRTPFTGVTGMLNALLYGMEDLQKNLQSQASLSAEQLRVLINEFIGSAKRYTQIALGSTDELLQLSNEILEVVRLESGKEKGVRSEAFRLRDCVERNIDLLRSVAEHKKINLTAEMDSRIPPYLEGIRHYLDRTLLNLISNSLKFTDTGYVKVTVAIADQTPQNTYQKGDRITLQIQVEDTGIGIPEDKFETIFEHFSRLTPSYQGTYKGSGLGLFIVKQFVEAMKGRIQVASEVGKGSCFTLTLPFVVEDHADRERQMFRMPEQRLKSPVTESEPSLTEAAAEPSASTHSTEQPDFSHLIKTRVLLVEDQPIAAQATKVYLDCMNCLTEVAPDGKTALQKASKNHYDFIFTDIGLPDTTGIEVARKIRALPDKKKATVPIAALTGHAENDHYRQACLDAGINEVLPKPAQQLALQSVLQQWVWEKTSETGIEQKQLQEQPSEQEAVSTLPLIDWEETLLRCSNNREVIDTVLPQIPASLQESKALLETAYLKQDTNALCAELHRLLGIVIFLSLPRVETALRRFQTAVKAEPQDPPHLERTYHELRQAFDAFYEAYEKGKLES